MGCGSGRAIAEIISGRVPEVDFAFTGIEHGRRAVLPEKRIARA
jgi:D-amino-acid dehydrogenase